MYRGGHDDKGTWTKESVQFLCTLIKRIDNLQELIDDANIATNKTNSSFKIQEDIKEAQRELKEYVESIVSQRLRTEIVPTLPDLTIIKENVIYMTPIPKLDEDGNPTGGSDGYNQYMFINGKIEYLGGTKISLTDYYTKQESNMAHTELEDKIDENKVLIGSITAYAGQTAPEGYMICDGTSLLKADYPELYAVIGDTYGSADADHFNIPDTRYRVIAGYDARYTNFKTMGLKGGTESVTLTTAQIPSHTHTFTGTAHTHTFTGSSHYHTIDTKSLTGYFANDRLNNGSGNTGGIVSQRTVSGTWYYSNEYSRSSMREININASHNHGCGSTTAGGTNSNTTAGGTNSNTGGGGKHNNLQPYIVLNHIIRVK